MSNVRFYRLGTLPSFDSTKHVGIFVHLTANTTINDKTYKAGLWFGGATGWEYLTNDTEAINAAIDAKIQALDVEGYEQATITTSTDSSTLTIKGIQEDNSWLIKYSQTEYLKSKAEALFSLLRNFTALKRQNRLSPNTRFKVLKR